MVEGLQPVLDHPQGFGALCAGEHVAVTAGGHGLLQCRIDRDQLRGRLDIQIIHAERGRQSLRVGGDGLPDVGQVDEEPHPVVVQIGGRLDGRGEAVRRLEVGVVLLFPALDAAELGGDGALEDGRAGHALRLVLDLAVDELVPLDEDGPLQRVGHDDLGIGLDRADEGCHQQGHSNDNQA